MKRITVAIGFAAGFALVFAPIFFQFSVVDLAGPGLIIVAMFLLLGVPAVRLRRLGVYLRQAGLNDIGGRGSFRTRDDHFFLDLSSGRWFQHSSFAMAYAGIVGMYLLGWYLIGAIFLLSSLPLLVIVLLASRRLATNLLSPFTPKDVAVKIEALFPPNPPKGILNPILDITLVYLVATAYFLSNELLTVFFTAIYGFVLLCLGIVRLRRRKAPKPKG